jgi:hypothetical protein
MPIQTSHSKKIQQLLVEKENANLQYESLREVIDSKHERIKELAKSRVENNASQAGEGVAVADSMGDSRTAYALSLFSKISSITWNYENSESISGCEYN